MPSCLLLLILLAAVEVPAGAADEYDRLIDYLREDVAVQKRLWVDVSRLVAAYLED